MDVDATIIFAGIGAFAVVGGAVMAYGELKTKVTGLTEKTAATTRIQEKLEHRLVEVEKHDDVHERDINDLRANSNKLFNLYEKQAEVMPSLASNMSTVKSDVHYMRQRIDDILAKKDG